MIYNIDVAGTCNLRCPSCPVGNHKQQGYGHGRKGGFMDIKMFEDILKKIDREQLSPITIQLYNWGEALLHPNYSEMVKLVRDRGWFCAVSTNLSHENIDIRKVAEHMPNHFRVSLSGFYQDTYSKGHRGGNVSLVKSNLYKLHFYINKKHGPKHLKNVEICYHVYSDNIDNNFSSMYWLSQELGFKFAPLWATLLPLEGALDYLNGNAAEDILSTAKRLLIPFEKRLEIAKRNPLPDCPLRTGQISIGHDGSVGLCCATYDERNNISPSFLQAPIEELQKLRYSHTLCSTCMRHGYHSMNTGNALVELNKISNQKLAEMGFPHTINISEDY